LIHSSTSYKSQKLDTQKFINVALFLDYIGQLQVRGIPDINILTDEVESEPILDFPQYGDTICNIIKASNPRFSVGIYGEWGTGKTTLMESIKDKIAKQTGIMIVWFNAWRFEREDQFAIVSLMKTIAYEMGKHELYKNVEPYFWDVIKSMRKGLTAKSSS
jgi:hypothetical protein